MDTRTKEQRSRIMKSISAQNTGPELRVRKLLHSVGYRFRLHAKDLPGRPDIVFRSRRKAIFVHGCFWHGHGCSKGRLPKSRTAYWGPKIAANQDRDRKVIYELGKSGWQSLVIWQCQVNDREQLEMVLKEFLAKEGGGVNG
jgi:DNA mismatch endonuclease (patch repair protein)